ncbi:MAG: nucleotide exchange factor GrpE [Mangrovibacterium sp.]
MAEEKIVNEQENEAAETNPEQVTASDDMGKHEDKHDKKSKKDKAHDQIEKLENDLADMKDKYVRLQAEFDNFRKRTLKEKTELIKAGGESVLKNIIPVVDDLDRAVASFTDVKDDTPLKQGVMLIYNKFQDFLKQNGVKEIEAKGKDFDTDLHEAIVKIPAPEEGLKGKVVDVVQKGYQLFDKVIRFAKVVVGE